ncbi:alkaline phosphatase PhoX [Maribacter sp. CXY002]|uniref:alkaline phosphatase PhoX n=1 Tax=Maribacter luteocoastalis TaxID=3407671 RepID=UPI003B66F899
MKLKFLILFFFSVFAHAQNIGDFTSVTPIGQNTDFIFPSSHIFQKIIYRDDPLTQGGTLPRTTDFTGYVPINGSNENGYLSINAEIVPGAVSILDINFNPTTKLWSTTLSASVDFSGVAGTIANCSGTVTPWNTIISCEEYTSKEIASQYPFPIDSNGDGYDDYGWAVEIDPATKTVIDKRWALGNFKHENLVIHSNQRTAYQGADATVGYLFKFVANNPQDLSSGNLYVYRGAKNGSGEWVLLDNTTPAERNSTNTQSAAIGATVFNGIEDVEIGPDGLIYFAVKSEDQVYRFQDSDPINGTTVINMETYVGNRSYTITHESGTSDVNWGYGNDNLAFDGDGNLWVMNDGENNYIWVVKNGHTQNNPKVEVFGIAPAGSEPTGITFSPDFRFLFMSIQHPSSSNSATTQTDAAGNEVAFDKDTALVIALKENLGTTTEPEYDWYLDADGDGYAVLPIITNPTSPGIGYTQNVLPTTDCDDTDPNVFEVTTWYLDADGDGYAVAPTIDSCSLPGTGYTQEVLPTTDCDDNDSLINPTTVWYLDVNEDGVVDSEETIINCEKPGEGYTSIEPITLSTDKNIIVYPNPSMETFEIDLGQIHSKVNLTIINSNKQLVFEKQFENKRIIEVELLQISSGIYFIHLSNQEGLIGTKKIIKL